MGCGCSQALRKKSASGVATTSGSIFFKVTVALMDGTSFVVNMQRYGSVITPPNEKGIGKNFLVDMGPPEALTVKDLKEHIAHYSCNKYPWFAQELLTDEGVKMLNNQALVDYNITSGSKVSMVIKDMNALAEDLAIKIQAAWRNRRSDEKIPELELIEAFQANDHQGFGIISTAELRHIVTTMGEKFDDAEADKLIDKADQYADGQCDYKQFVASLSSYSALFNFFAMVDRLGSIHDTPDDLEGEDEESTVKDQKCKL